MASRRDLINEDGEVRPLTAGDVAHFKPFSDLPAAEQSVLLRLGKRGPQKAPTKVAISIRLSADVAEALRASGSGWQARADEALRAWLSEETALRAGAGL